MKSKNQESHLKEIDDLLELLEALFQGDSSPGTEMPRDGVVRTLARCRDLISSLEPGDENQAEREAVSGVTLGSAGSRAEAPQSGDRQSGWLRKLNLNALMDEPLTEQQSDEAVHRDSLEEDLVEVNSMGETRGSGSLTGRIRVLPKVRVFD